MSLNVLNTHTGEITTVEGIDDSVWTVGQPVFMPMVDDSSTDTSHDSNTDSINAVNIKNSSNSNSSNSKNEKPVYKLAYTAWKNGPKKLGMIC